MPSQESYTETVIETGIIVDIDLRRWTVDIGTQHSDKQLFGVPWLSPYLHPENGEGFHLVPELGAQCLVCTPSDGENSPFIIGYLPVPKGDAYRSNRINMNPGDMGMYTRDGNFMLVRRGGVVQIGATQIAQRMYIPVNNLIRDFAENYSLTTFGGELVWETDRQATKNNQTPTRYVLRAKQYAEEANGGEEYFPVVLTVGTTQAGDSKTKRPGQDNLKNSGLENASAPLVELDISVPGQPSFNMAFDGNGNFYAKVGGSGRWDFEKDLVLNIKRNRTVNVTGTDSLEAQTRRVKVTTHELEYQTSSEKGRTKKIDASAVLMGNLATPTFPVVLGPLLTAALGSGALVATMPTPAGPVPLPVVPGPNFASLQNAFSLSVKASK